MLIDQTLMISRVRLVDDGKDVSILLEGIVAILLVCRVRCIAAVVVPTTEYYFLLKPLSNQQKRWRVKTNTKPAKSTQPEGTNLWAYAITPIVQWDLPPGHVDGFIDLIVIIAVITASDWSQEA